MGTIGRTEEKQGPSKYEEKTTKKPLKGW